MDVNIIRGKATLTRTADAYAGTLSVGDTAYVNGGIYLAKVDAGNTTTTPTANFNSIGAKTIVRSDMSALQIGELKASGWITLLYESSADKMVLVSGVPDEIGVDTTALTGGGGTTYTLIPGQNNPIQLITGSATLTTNYVFTFGGSPKDGDRFMFDYRATMTLGAQTITIAGISLTAQQALDGNLWIEAYYDTDGAAWRAKLFSAGTAKLQQTFANKAARDAAVPDFNGQIGVQVDIDVVYQSTGTSAGNWADIDPIGRTVYVDGTRGHTAAQGATGAKSNPFSTLAEARTVAVALSPSATSKVLIKAFPGNYAESLILANHVDWDLTDVVLALTGESAYSITDNNVACNSVVYGFPTLTSEYQSIVIDNASSSVIINLKSLTQSGSVTVTGGGIYNDGTLRLNVTESISVNSTGTALVVAHLIQNTKNLFITCPVVSLTTTVSNTLALSSTGTGTFSLGLDTLTTSSVLGTAVIAANVFSSSSLYMNIKKWTLSYDLSLSNGYAVNIETNRGFIKIDELVSASATPTAAPNAFAIISGSGTAPIVEYTGNIFVTGSTTYGLALSSVVASGISKFSGRIKSADAALNMAQSNGVAIAEGIFEATGTNKNGINANSAGCILKNSTIIGTGTGVSISNNATIQLQGYNNTNKTIGTGVTVSGSGSLNFNSATT